MLQTESIIAKIYNYNKLGIKYQIKFDDKGNIVDIDTNPKITQNENESECNLPLPTYSLDNKKMDMELYGGLTMQSKRAIYEQHRFIYENNLDIDKLCEDLKVSKRTVKDRIKKLTKLDCNVVSIENTSNGLIYKLNYGIVNEDTGNLHKFITINNKMLNELVTSFDSNAIKLYCVLCYATNTNEFKIITEKWLCEQIGLSGSSERAKSSIRTMIASLEKCKFVETKKDNVFKFDDIKQKKVPQINKYYRLCTFEEWKLKDDKVRK